MRCLLPFSDNMITAICARLATPRHAIPSPRLCRRRNQPRPRMVVAVGAEISHGRGCRCRNQPGPSHADTVSGPCLRSHRCHWHNFPVRSKDIALGGGKCFLCMGKGYTTCTVCNGVGMVDKVRRGGTDTEGKWLGKEKEAMDPLTPQVVRPKDHVTRLKTFSAALEHAAASARVCGCVGAVRMRGV